MKALVLEEAGGPEKLRLQDLPRPRPGPREAVVRVRACGVCHHDVAIAHGLLRRGVRLPLVLGHEIAGEIVRVGREVKGFVPQDRVVFLHGGGIGHSLNGGYEQYVVLPEERLVKFGPEPPWEQAALLSCPMGVVFRALRRDAQLQAGETVLVTGASGGLGIHAVQLAKLAGARVIGVTTSAYKVAKLRGLGADEVVFSPNLEFHEQVMALTAGEGVDVALDTVGGAAFTAIWKSLAPCGRVCLLGEIAGAELRLDVASLASRGIRMYGSQGAERVDIEALLKLVVLKRVKPVVSQTFPLEEGPGTHQLLEEKGSLGRLVLLP